MSDDEDDDGELFADSDDTAELIASSRKQSSSAPVAKKKGSATGKSKSKASQPDADNESDNDKGLFDSDSDDDNDKPASKKAASKKSASKSSAPMSKRERLEALANRHRKDEPEQSSTKKDTSKERKKPDSANKKEDKGYDSGDSYDSGDFQRTKEDDDFIDTTGEDADAVNELYAEQHFDDDRPDDDSDTIRKKKNKHKRKIRYGDDNPDRVSMGGNPDVEPDNPIMAAVHRMKKKKIQKKGLSEMEEEIKAFLNRMEMAAEEDEQLIAEKKPATKKLSMLNEVCDMLTKRDMQRMLLDFDLLSACKRWVQPLANGTLGNVTVRQRIIEAIGNMTGETGITASDLKRSEFGKVVMVLFKHRSETPGMKRQLKVLIEQWSRPIFQKSGNMRDLDRVARGSETGLAAIARQTNMQQQSTNNRKSLNSTSTGSGAFSSKVQNPDELNALITGNAAGGKKLEAGVNRVRVPYSRGFAFSVRPTARVDTPEKGGRGAAKGATGDTRGNLVKRMADKSKSVGKNQRSANISVEGRATKG